MSLSLKKVQAILEKENYHVILTEKRIRDNTHPSGNYYQYFEMELSSKWEYSLVINQRVNQPKKKEVKEFHNESDGAKYFLLENIPYGQDDLVTFVFS
ncbi:hypothetical protein JCM19046_4893 [Bacillus sp. JCM 19046]|nr:hypothetical protein JCM19045_13 [Bacillus sp. JCM 19045]GAF20187.1 hypothetical protein JCM19046_4893 [Bacillus sp. JCM 19046]